MFQSSSSDTHGPRLSGTSGNPGFSRRALTVVRTVVLTLFCLVPLALGTWSCNDDDRIIQRYPSIKSGDGSTVGGMGGTVKYVPSGTPNVEVDLNFPAGAVPNGTAIAVEEDDSFPMDPDIDMVSGLVFRFGPEGIVFGAPVVLTITYDPSSLGSIEPGDIRIFKTVGSGWEALETTLDTVAHTISALMPGFCWAGAGVPYENEPPVTRAVPAGGDFSDCVDVYVVCDDGEGVGCMWTKVQKVVGGVDAPFTWYEGGPIRLVEDTTLRFWSDDWFYNWGAVYSEDYYVSGCGDIPPTNTTAADFINSGEESTTSLELSLEISATDDEGVTAYLVQSHSALAPDATDPDWVAVTSTTSFSGTVSYTHPDDSDGLKTVYVFFKDEDGLVSEGASDTITYTASEGPQPQGVLIDFETRGWGTPWRGGGPVRASHYQHLGVVFDFSGNSMGGYGVPYVMLWAMSNPQEHCLTNDRIGVQSLTGTIHMRFSVTPPEVSFSLQYPEALGAPPVIEIVAANGQELPNPESVIERIEVDTWRGSKKHDITISWSSGISEIRVLATRSVVYVDDLGF